MYFSRGSGQGGKEFDESFAEWASTRRVFSDTEPGGTRWAKIGAHGYAFNAELLADGTVRERRLMPNRDEWRGNWHIDSRMLVISVGDHELFVIASKNGLHSGVEFKSSEPSCQVYFRAIQIW